MRLYEVRKRGLTFTVQMSDAHAKRVGAKPVEVAPAKVARKPRAKAKP